MRKGREYTGRRSVPSFPVTENVEGSGGVGSLDSHPVREMISGEGRKLSYVPLITEPTTSPLSPRYHPAITPLSPRCHERRLAVSRP